jgi:hypothetical protein
LAGNNTQFLKPSFAGGFCFLKMLGTDRILFNITVENSVQNGEVTPVTFS